MATSPEAVLSAEHSSEFSQETSATHEEKAAVSEEDSEFSVIDVYTTGGENAPIWTFESRRLGGYLLGWFNHKLSDLYLSNGKIVIRAEFKTSAPAILIQKIDSMEYLEMKDGKKMAVQAQLRKLLYEKILEKSCLAYCELYQA